MSPQHTALSTSCPACNGLGQTLSRGAMVYCEECNGEGIVPAVMHYDYVGTQTEDGIEYEPPCLIAIPKENR